MFTSFFFILFSTISLWTRIWNKIDTKDDEMNEMMYQNYVAINSVHDRKYMIRIKWDKSNYVLNLLFPINQCDTFDIKWLSISGETTESGTTKCMYILNSNNEFVDFFIIFFFHIIENQKPINYVFTLCFCSCRWHNDKRANSNWINGKQKGKQSIELHILSLNIHLFCFSFLIAG